MTMTWQELANEVEEINRANGWYDKKRTEDEEINLIQSEMFEWYEAIRKPGQPSKKAEGFTGEQEEIADILIRVVDTVNRKKRAYVAWPEECVNRVIGSPSINSGDPPTSRFRQTMKKMGRASHPKDEVILAFQWALNEVLINPFDLEACLRAKLDYNRSRGYRHGGKEI